MDPSGTPPVSVVIPTRSRGDRVLPTVLALLACDYPDFEVRIVDQSDDGRTAAALAPFLGDSRVRYARSDTRGIASALNAGIERATGEILAITGDDCEIPSDWITALVAAIESDPRVGIVFGNVTPGPHDDTLGFVPGYVRETPDVARCLKEKHRVGGTSACMGLRKSAWVALGGFDPSLGVGARFHSAEDTDLALRALAAGWIVSESPAARVVHTGFYTWAERSALLHLYWYGSGAAFVKQLKRRPWSTGIVLARLAGRWVSSRSRVARSFGERPHRLRGAVSFVQGLLAGGLVPVDPATGHYRSRTSPGGLWTSPEPAEPA
jgi:GT2 family glycosyltransferase